MSSRPQSSSSELESTPEKQKRNTERPGYLLTTTLEQAILEDELFSNYTTRELPRVPVN